jgi:hypothetical protein
MTISKVRVSTTAISGKQRQWAKRVVEKLRGEYTGELKIGGPDGSTHLVCGAMALHNQTDKAKYARENDIVLVTIEWLEACESSKKFVSHAPFIFSAVAVPSATSTAVRVGSPSPPPPERLRDRPVSVAVEKNALPFLDFPALSNTKATLDTPVAVPSPAMVLKEPAPLPQMSESPALNPVSPQPDANNEGFLERAAQNLEAVHLGPPQQQEPELSPSAAAMAWAPTSSSVFSRAMSRPPVPVLEAVRAHHCLSKAQLAAVEFYAAADITPATACIAAADAGHAVRFRVGNVVQGAKMLYDVAENGVKIIARALPAAFYVLPLEVAQRSSSHSDGQGMPNCPVFRGFQEKNDEADTHWFAHAYLLSRADLLERKAWRPFLKAEPMGDDDLLLSAGLYCSPAHLVVGEFGLTFPSLAPEEKERSGQDGRAVGMPVQECR